MTVRKAILQRVQKLAAGAVFTPSDFTDLGTPHAVGMALGRLVRGGRIRRAGRGLYDYPREHPELGALSPDIQQVAKALAGKERIRLQPAGAYSANLLGLSEQVPAKVVFLTDGPTRTVKLGRQEIQLRRTTPRNMAMAGRLSGLLTQALRHLGKEHITPARLAHLKRTLPARERQRLLHDLPLAPAWMHPLLRELAAPGS